MDAKQPENISLGHLLTQNNFIIGRDVIPVNPDTIWHEKCSPESYPPRNSFHFLYNLGDAFVGNRTQGTYVIANERTNEYYITTNRDTVAFLQEKGYSSKGLPQEALPMAFSYNDIQFENAKTQKNWAKHCEYMEPENVAKRKRMEKDSALRKGSRTFQEEQMKKGGAKSVKDVIRVSGFVPNDYVEIKNGMVDLGPDIATNKEEVRREIRLPKEEEVAAKYYIISEGGRYMIGNTDKNEAIVTKNRELVEEFREQKYMDVSVDFFMDYYVPHHYGVHFEDDKIQAKWKTHELSTRKQEQQINSAVARYVKNNAVPHGKATEIVLEKRRAERMEKRNLTPKEMTLRHRLDLSMLKHQKENKKRQEAEQHTETRIESTKMPSSNPNILKRVFGKLIGR